MERRGFLSFGSLVTDHNIAIDRFPPEDQVAIIASRSAAAGGPGFNAAANLRRLDPSLPVQVQGLIGDDENGEVILNDLRKVGIPTEGVHLTKAEAQNYVEVMSSAETGRRTFFFFRGAAGLLNPSHCDPSESAARILHVGAAGLHEGMDCGVPGGGNGWTDVLERGRAAGMRTNMEMVSLEGAHLRPLIVPCLPLLDSLIINDLEGQAVSGVAIRKGERVDWDGAVEACRRIVELGVRQVVAIHFPEGGVAVDAEGAAYRQASVRWPKSRIVSAVGAGDAFAAGLLYGLHEGWPIDRGMELAVAVAAVSFDSLDTTSAIGSWRTCLAEAARYGHREVGAPTL